MLMLLVQCKTVAFITSIFLSDIVVEADHVSSKLEVRISVQQCVYNLYHLDWWTQGYGWEVKGRLYFCVLGGAAKISVFFLFLEDSNQCI